MFRNIGYARMHIDGDKMVKDHNNHYRLVGQREYRGKAESGLKPGVTVSLQVLEDRADPGMDKKTGRPLENNLYETIDVTLPGVAYPLPFHKGDEVSIFGFMPEASYFIDFNFIIRFSEIRPFAPQSNGNGNNDKKG